MPFVVSAGYIRLVRRSGHSRAPSPADTSPVPPQRIVVLKDQTNKAAHESSAQLACEAAAAIRTVASLTREDECLALYADSLAEPLRRSNRTAIYSNLLYSLSQAMVFFVIALVFWYGSRLVASTEYTTKQFFICLMVRAL